MAASARDDESEGGTEEMEISEAVPERGTKEAVANSTDGAVANSTDEAAVEEGGKNHIAINSGWCCGEIY